MKTKPINLKTYDVQALLAGRKTQHRVVVKFPEPKEGWHVNNCPLGKPGDLLWVREAWCIWIGGNIYYRADNPTHPVYWEPNSHLHKKDSRLTLKLTDIRLERLQDISEEDAIAEGTYLARCSCNAMLRKLTTPIEVSFTQTWCHIHGDEYRHKWKDSWEANPFVWALSFEVINKNVDEVFSA